MRLVKHHQRVCAQQASVVRSHLRRNAVAGEQEARSYHVDRADDDYRHGWIGKPCAIVEVLTAQGRNGQRLSFETESRLQVLGCIEEMAELFRLSRRLIHDGTPINDVDKSVRDAISIWLLCERSRQQPDRHH
jgi:hypothetical protein